MLHLLLSEDWTVCRDVIMKRLSDDVRNHRGNRILIVPELISHETERRLCACAGDTSSRYGEVVSFTRLANRVTAFLESPGMECLDNGGRVVAMAAAARQLSSKLKAYASVETKPEFLSDLVNAMDEFKRCCITSRDLMEASLQTEGSLAQKLEELSLLTEAYDALCLQGKRDPRDQLTYLLELLEESDFARSHTFYIDGFPDFTRQNMAILEHLIRESPEVTIGLNCDAPGSALLAYEKAGATAQELIRCANQAGVEIRIEHLEAPEMPLKDMRRSLFQGPIPRRSGESPVRTYTAESAYQSVLHGACAVRELIESGCRYRDISLVCTDPEAYFPLIRFIFHRFHIPVYLTGKEDILQKSAVATVMTALDAALCGFEQRETLRFMRSAMSPLSQDACDAVENYAITWSVRGAKWTQEWNMHPDGLSCQWDGKSQELLDQINVHRELAIAPLAALRRGFLEAKDVCGQVRALYRFLEDIRLESRLRELADQLDSRGDNREAQILNQLWDILVDALEQLYDVLGQTQWEPEHFYRLLRLLLSQYDVGTIPPVLDAVHVGPVTAMRCNQQKHLIVLGAEEGKLPGYSGSSGILTDQERVTLRQMGVPLTGGALEGIQAEFSEIYGVFCGAMETVSVYSCTEQPSFLFRRLSELSGGAVAAHCEAGMAFADDFEAGAFLASFQAEDAAGKLNLQESYRQVCMQRNYDMGKLDRKTVRKLYGNTLNLSASQIDRQAECRMSYYLKYGLRVKERKEAQIDPAEFGTYVHAVLEQTARCIRDMGGFAKVSMEQTLELAHRFSEEYAREHFQQLESERMVYLFRRNIQELDMVVRELWLEMQESLFEPVDFEVNFGGEDALPPIAIPNPAMDAKLSGFVDRVDVWNTSGSSYYRVVDYKTGRKDFDYCDVFNGVGLQMLLYMFALRDSGSGMLGKSPVPAGVQYFPARAPYLPADGVLSEEQAEEVRASHWKRKGLLLEDQAVLQAMEPGEKPKRMSYSVKKDGSLSGDLADRDQMKLLEEYVFGTLSALVEDIASGNVEPNPYTRGSSHNACDYCPYGPICHEKDIAGRRNYKAMTAQRFWEEIGKKGEKHG